MSNRKGSISFLSKYIHQLETNIQNFTIPSLYGEKLRKKEEEQTVEETITGEEEEIEKSRPPPCPDFAPFQLSRETDSPSVCVWSFMGKSELDTYLSLHTKKDMRCALEKKLGVKPKGIPRIILIEFMLDATIFCQNSRSSSQFELEHCGAILGMYYLTHKYFTDHLCLCPEDVLDYFKQFLLHHSLLFPPTHVKLFNIDQCKGILLHFSTLYLRHMPLIRLLALPNFCFELDYELEPEFNLEKKGKKDKKDKKDKKKDKKSSDKKSKKI